MSTAKPRGKRIALFCLTPGGKSAGGKDPPAAAGDLLHQRKTGVGWLLNCSCDGFAATLQQAFAENDALIVIGATGITVRVFGHR